jgi:hypothetical protein
MGGDGGQASFPEYSVRIVEVERPDYPDPKYMLEVLDENGRVIEGLEGTATRNPNRPGPRGRH